MLKLQTNKNDENDMRLIETNSQKVLGHIIKFWFHGCWSYQTTVEITGGIHGGNMASMEDALGVIIVANELMTFKEWEELCKNNPVSNFSCQIE